MTTTKDILTATADIAIEMFADLDRARMPTNTPGQMLSHLLHARRTLDRIIVRAERATINAPVVQNVDQ
jgi:hypothetical protein